MEQARMKRFAIYRFCSTWDGDGEISNQTDEVVWRFQTKPEANSPVDFVLSDATGKLVTITRERSFPFAKFAVIRDELRLGTISQRNIWFTRYEFKFGHTAIWNVYLPMFSVSGKAISGIAPEICLNIQSRREWFARISVGIDNPPMMAALAYTVRKKLQCT